MKYVTLVLFAMIALSCKKKNYYYTCYCSPKNGNGISDALVIGRANSDVAYAKCKSFKDTSQFNCIMQVIK